MPARATLLSTVLALALSGGLAVPAEAAGSASASTAPRITVTMPLYDAPGATVPVVVSVSPVPAGSSVTIALTGGSCPDQSGGTNGTPAQWSFGSTVARHCLFTLPRTAWRGDVTATATATMTGPNVVTSTIHGKSARTIYTSGYGSGTLSPAEIASVDHCGNTSRYVWLTFDDRLPSSATARSLIAVLARNHARGRFFLNTLSARDRTLLTAAGHLVENHTRDHPALNTLTDAAIRRQIAGGPTPSGRPRLLRPPYGAGSYSTRVEQVAAAAGYRLCRWTTDTRDWTGASADQLYRTVRYGSIDSPPAGAGGVILMHATHFSAAKLQAVIDAVRARGLTPEPSAG